MDNPQFLLFCQCKSLCWGKLRLLTERTVDELHDHEPADATTVSCLYSFFFQYQKTPGYQHAAPPMCEEIVLCRVV